MNPTGFASSESIKSFHELIIKTELETSHLTINENLELVAKSSAEVFKNTINKLIEEKNDGHLFTNKILDNENQSPEISQLYRDMRQEYCDFLKEKDKNLSSNLNGQLIKPVKSLKFHKNIGKLKTWDPALKALKEVSDNLSKFEEHLSNPSSNPTAKLENVVSALVSFNIDSKLKTGKEIVENIYDFPEVIQSSFQTLKNSADRLEELKSKKALMESEFEEYLKQIIVNEENKIKKNLKDVGDAIDYLKYLQLDDNSKKGVGGLLDPKRSKILTQAILQKTIDEATFECRNLIIRILANLEQVEQQHKTRVILHITGKYGEFLDVITVNKMIQLKPEDIIISTKKIESLNTKIPSVEQIKF